MRNPCRIIAFFLLGFAWQLGIDAQEVITTLFDNPRATAGQATRVSAKKAEALILLELPIFDDFSDSDIKPKDEYWSNASAFVNNNFSIYPVSNGVATLDALDSAGNMYAHAVISPNTFVADHLSSFPIKLDYPASDSIYLSFLFQPGGLCDVPEEGDSLMVDFYATDSAQWINVWSVPGSDLKPFQHAMIPVTDSRFLVEGFRFRFRNRASLPRNNDYPDMRSNVDYWHVDYIRLHTNRFVSDTVLSDVAFISPLNSILKDLSSLPWAHFEPAYNAVFGPIISGRYKNNDTITRNVTRSLAIYEPAYGESHNPGVPTAQDLPGMEDTVVNFPFIYPFDFDRGESALIQFKAALRTDENDPKMNDTVVHDQIFKDYYAYDDGTSEAGYGLRGSGTAGGLVAMKYNSYKADYLGGVYISFNHVYDSLNLGYYFKLVVWDDAEGQPGSVIWEDEKDYKVEYPSTYPGFVKYQFSEPVPVDGPFYVGWRQYNQYILNAGLDLNSIPANPVMYYNIQGIWQASEAPGVMMFRPFLYDESTGVENSKKGYTTFEIYPNPAKDLIYFNLPENLGVTDLKIEIMDASGRLIRNVRIHSTSLDISDLHQGIYYLRVVSGSIIYYSKLLINP
jgi:hypothetical protein